MALLKAGGRWASSVCDTEVIVVKGPEDEVSLTCGGADMVEAGSDPVSGELDDSGAVSYTHMTLPPKRIV